MQWSAKRSTLSALLVAVIALVSTVTGAFGQGAPVGGSGAHYALRNSLGDGGADLAYSYGTSSDVVLVGDWDGDGVDTLGLRRGKTYYLRNSHSGGNADVTYAYGAAGDAVLVGDWNGDGTDTLGVRRGNLYHLRNSHSGGNADLSFSYGAATDTVFAGDWDGNQTDTLGTRSPVAVTPVAPPTDTRLTFADEFNGAAGTPPDSARWKHDIGGHGWGNNELQYYTDSTSNAAHDGFGNMVITARQGGDGHTCHYGLCQFTSARLLTAERFAQRYGRFEARIKIPGGQGAWPAFWMLNSTIATDPWPSSGEIDVMENIGREPGTVWGSLHGPGYSGANAANGSVTLRDGRAFSEDFHVFAVDWQPDSVTWFVDGVPYSRKTPEDIGGNPWVVDDPFFLLLNLAIGGDWPGSPDATTPFPLRMLVDYVRVHAWEGDDGATAEPAYAIHGLAEKCIDVAGGTAAPGTAVQLWECTGGPGQRWTFPDDGTVRALGLCLEVVGASRANGAELQLADCTAGPGQRFVLNASHDLVNTAADKCVDVREASTANGARLQIWDCAGTVNQKWWRRAL